ncbi:phosphoribosylglycinamide formyltransferase [Annulohypoxylon maeteangense]|uniref:phosphoribosylglycinamide formyltransferase n=1 Tax=Annulohypoxylon maeteangense TaxID=1927788 RepID=UPI002008381F|nr:phosphoribosylglycinamide formyltransferase [Annulohypoxylon maeteangense]KAI0889815.1 phosphoribosylglycinamide formyltransferase [Annulohypoxylon maeteangense]
MIMAEARISVLCSGNGSNLQALIDSSTSNAPDSIRGKIIKVTVNRKGAYATTRAEKAGIPTDYFNLVKDGYQKLGEKDPAVLKEARLKYDADLAERILRDKPDLVVLAGWMHVLSTNFLRPFSDAGVPIINLHPALPGAYDGAGAIERAYEDFKAGKLEDNTTGIMIHYVIAEVDRGEPILVQKIQIQEGESLEDLEQKIHGCEHGLIVKATALLAEKISAAKAANT